MPRLAWALELPLLGLLRSFLGETAFLMASLCSTCGLTFLLSLKPNLLVAALLSDGWKSCAFPSWT